MRTKHFYLCLLLLVLGAANVWADKYYQPWDYRHEQPRYETLDDMVGQKFMIYNTALNGTVDHTGFFYDNGTAFGLDKTKERDRFVYNEKFVYTLEKITDADGVACYAIKSITSGTYVAANGTTIHAAAQPLYITSWDDAKTYNSGNEESAPDWKLSGVRSEDANFAGIENGEITNAKNKVFIIANTATPSADTKYWNGDAFQFLTYSNGHPIAFYKVREVQSGSYLQDLHIFSRSDIYSAQVIWGYIQNSTQITISPESNPAANTALLIDGDLTTGVSTAAGTGSHYFQFNLGKQASGIYLYMQRSSADGAVNPTSVKIQGATAADGPYTDVATLTTDLDKNLSYTSDAIECNYQYIRVVNAATDAQMALSEIYILPVDTKTTQSLNYFKEVQKADCPIYSRAIEKEYAQTIANYNSNFAEAKTLSGVPLPGNKYRIYADAYNGTSYENKEISLGTSNGADVVDITPAGSYHGLSGDDAKKYEWYCEQTADGKLVFRNVYAASDAVEGDLYLANNGTVSSTPYKWSMSTVQTSRHGVPLWGDNNKYLAIANDGSGWIDDVKAAQNQAVAPYTVTSTTTTTDPDTGEETTTTTTTTVSATGVCTDFVFIPVEVLAAEKKITITANEIAQRNITLTYNNETYSLPFSRMFVETDAMPKITLNCKDIHSLASVIDGTGADVTQGDAPKASYDEVNGVVSFNFANVKDADMFELKLTIGPPFVTGSGHLYLIRNKFPQSVAQQAPSMPRRSATNVPIAPGEQVATSEGNLYYARYEGSDVNMTLVASSSTVNYDNLDATSLFYFEDTEDESIDKYYSVNIHSAITALKCAAPNSWTKTGKTWYVQPNSKGKYNGYAIGRNELNATNNPGDAWRAKHDDGDLVTPYYANDDASAWEFIEVPFANAAELLKEYITTTDDENADGVSDGLAHVVINKIENLPAELKSDAKAQKYTALANKIISDVDAVDAAAAGETDIATLVDLMQQTYALSSEVEYALQALPLVTDRAELDNDNHNHPHWYYIYNVKSKMDDANHQAYYAKFRTKNTYMALDQLTDADSDGDKDFGLEHMFYLEGTEFTDGELTDGSLAAGSYNQTITDNNLLFDDYLQVDVHNFMVPDTTLVSANEILFQKSIDEPGNGESDGMVIANGFELLNKETWRIECEYDFSDGRYEQYNTYGSCLLTSSDNPGDNYYKNEFQVYLKDDFRVVVKLNTSDDRYFVDHTCKSWSKIKIVITHSPVSTTFSIYNAEGEKEDITVPGTATLNPVTQLKTMLKENVCKINVLSVEYVNAYVWEAEDDVDADVAKQKDTWYVLPSSNTTYPGFAIVAGGADDTNLGWTNVEAANEEIFSDIATADNSTWQFEKILEFDAHAAQLLEKYAASDCVIYNEELARLVRLIKKNASYINAIDYDDETTYIDGHSDEYFFNEIYAAIKDYDGPMPDELKAPKPGKFYTVRPAYGDSDLRLLANEYNTMVQKSSLEEVVDGNTHRDSRIAWFFDGTEENGFYKLDNTLLLNSLHTQSNTNVFAADSVLLDDVNAAPITLVPVGGCIVRLYDGINNLRHKAMGDSILLGNAGTMSYGYASTEFERKTIDGVETVETTSFNEFNEILLGESQKTTVTVTSNYAYKGTGYNVTAGILCPNVNGNNGGPGDASIVDKPIELTFTYTNLPASFTSFNSIGLDIHALNGESKYQQNADNKARQWNIAVSVSTDGGSTYSDFGSVSDIDIAAGIGQSEVSVHKVWNIVKSDEAQDFVINGSLVVKLTIQKGTTNNGCFFGLSNIILSAEGDTWYIEEIPDAEKQYIYHETTTYSAGFSSLMLGFNATIPANVKAFYPITNNDLSDKHVTLHSYKKVLPALAPAILHNVPEGQSGVYKFYYTDEAPTTVTDKATAADDKIIIDGALYRKVVQVSSFDDANPSAYEQEIGEDVNVYMYLSNKTLPKMYWVYENYQENGEKLVVNGSTNHDEGGWVNVNANRAFLVIGKSKAKSIASLSMRFDNSPTTGIEDIYDDHRIQSISTAVKGIFDLQGRKLHKITAPGMYIVDGEKVLVE